MSSDEPQPLTGVMESPRLTQRGLVVLYADRFCPSTKWAECGNIRLKRSENVRTSRLPFCRLYNSRSVKPVPVKSASNSWSYAPGGKPSETRLVVPTLMSVFICEFARATCDTDAPLPSTPRRRKKRLGSIVPGK